MPPSRQITDQIVREAIRLYSSGMTITEVQNVIGFNRGDLSRRMRSAGYTLRPRVRRGQKSNLYRGGANSNAQAHDQLEWALQKGTIVRPEKCETCGALGGKRDDGKSVIEAHHPDYNKPLEVNWLCRKCHREWHKHNRAIGVGEVSVASTSP